MITNLMLLRNKLSNYKLLGIKISTIFQVLNISSLKIEKKAILNELLKILSVEEN
jgi:hypothetical protein